MQIFEAELGIETSDVAKTVVTLVELYHQMRDYKKAFPLHHE